MNKTFQQKLDAIITMNNSLVCVGLDSDFKKLPLHLLKKRHPLFTFNKAIIDLTYDLVCAYKPNTAFYEAYGTEGISELKMTCDYLKKSHESIPIIIDAKRADIGSTNEGYARFIFDYLGADALTIHPYLGYESVVPFLRRKDKGISILCKTSNPGAGEYQNICDKDTNEPLYLTVARHVAKSWNTNDNCMLVVGATYPEELANIRTVVGDMTLLVPGIGAQGGNVKEVMHAGLNSKKRGLIINSSRAIIFASSDVDFASQARNKTEQLKEEINNLR